MKRISTIFVTVALLIGSLSVQAQQVSTLYFLENNPSRHFINPAFEPVSKFYFLLPVAGYTSLWTGSNSLALQDLVYNYNGKTVTALYNRETQQDLYNHLSAQTAFDLDMTLNLLSFGFRIKDFGYAHLDVTEHIEGGVGLPKGLLGVALGNDLSTLNLTQLNLNTMAYTDIALGYSHRINEKWTVGGKLKVLLGEAYANAIVNKFTFSTNPEYSQMVAEGDIRMAGLVDETKVPSSIGLKDVTDIPGLLYQDPLKYVEPSGIGGAIDLGFTYKPIKMLQIAASVTDLGFIHWYKNLRGTMNFEGSYTGIGDFKYSDFIYNGEFRADSLLSKASTTFSSYADSLQFNNITSQAATNMITAKLNVGIDANFWNNRVGIGVYSRTRFLPQAVYEEITFGAAFRPVNWFNLAVSYSLLNGRGNSLGAAMSLATYDGLMFTVAADYIPTSYVNATMQNITVPLSYKTNGVNVSFGVAIVVGTNNNAKRKDSDKDGVADAYDLCPKTPINVHVDAVGCPLDNDGDAVPDYLDKCAKTPSMAYGLVDTCGCPIDTDNDGVPDYLDQCPNTPPSLAPYVDETGCMMDTDGDGVPDYLDQCPGTPAAAYGKVDSIGCPLDTDKDGVPDYLDQCPNSPAEANGHVDQYGCPLDTDKDGVPDYKDQCPNTPSVAVGHINEVGCALDTDSDGVYDYEDLCPTIAGSAANRGCPEVKREVKNLLQRAMTGIEFENGKATIKKSSYAILDEIATTFIANPDYHVEVQGHTDNVGNAAFNQELSEKRAQAVRSYLVKKGVQPVRIEAHGYGDTKPIADNSTKAGRAQNRRVQFVVTFEQVTYELINDRVE